MTFVVRTSGDPSAVLRPSTDVIHELDPKQPVANAMRMDEVIGRALARPRLAAALAVALGALALIVAVIGVYGGLLDKFPAGAWMNRGLTLRAGQCHVHRYMAPLLARIERGEIDPTRVITHRLPLDEAPRGFDLFKNKKDNCEKVVLTA